MSIIACARPSKLTDEILSDLYMSGCRQHIPQSVVLVLIFPESKVPEMGDFQGPFIVSPPPSASSSEKSSITMLYYGLVVVGVAAAALALYNLMMMRRSRRRQMQSEGEDGLVEVVSESRIENLVSSRFKYKKEGVVGYDDECSVCLSGFEEGEEVRKLPQCKHWFHAPCIDMWLYSHLDCPICRTPVVGFSQTLMLESGNYERDEEL